MTLHLTSPTDKSRIIDLLKSICTFALFPRLDQFNKMNLVNAVQRVEDLARDQNLNLHCRFEQDVSGRTKVVMEISFGEISGPN